MDRATANPDCSQEDLSRAADEALVVCFKAGGSRRARDVVILRYHAWTNNLVNRYAIPFGLSAEDVQDAQQDAVFWIVEAMKCYDVGQINRPRGCHFRSFLYRVVCCRLKDSVRRRRRLDRYKNELPLAAALCNKSSSCPSCDGVSVNLGDNSDPAAIVEARELTEELKSVFQQLDSRTRQLVVFIARDVPLRVIAVRFGISYDATKRWRRKVMIKMRIALRERLEPASQEYEMAFSRSGASHARRGCA